MSNTEQTCSSRSSFAFEHTNAVVTRESAMFSKRAEVESNASSSDEDASADRSPVEQLWDTQQLMTLTQAFLHQCEALEQATSIADKLNLIRQTMTRHLAPDWSDCEVLALQGLMSYYRRQLLSPELSRADRIEILKRIYTDEDPQWMEAEIVQLHFLLLDECRVLANPKSPLARNSMFCVGCWPRRRNFARRFLFAAVLAWPGAIVTPPCLEKT